MHNQNGPDVIEKIDEKWWNSGLAAWWTIVFTVWGSVLVWAIAFYIKSR